jgi:hypothetical protein
MAKWEFKRLEVGFGSFESDLNPLGKDGWELVSLVESANVRNVYRAFLKRKIQEDFMVGV